MTSEPSRRSLNYHVLRIFSVVLIAAGALGFVLPPEMSLMSVAPAYNAFHVAFGLLGAALVVLGRDGPIRAFNAGFGAIDLYQALASRAHLFPEAHFRWKPADDALHVAIGLALVAVAVLGRRPAGGGAPPA